MTECNQKSLEFHPLGRREITARFDAPAITSDAGGLLLRELDSKFGFSIETGAAEEAVEQAMAAEHLDVAGLRFHLGSPIFELEPYSEAIDYVLKFAAEMRDEHGLRLTEFNPGGGFAVGYVGEELPPPISAYAGEISVAVRSGCDRYGLEEPLLTVQ